MLLALPPVPVHSTSFFFKSSLHSIFGLGVANADSRAQVRSGQLLDCLVVEGTGQMIQQRFPSSQIAEGHREQLVLAWVGTSIL